MEEKIIQFVATRSMIYDKSSYQYKNVIAKEKAWETLSEELQVDIKTLKRRWKTLRDNFYKISKRIETDGETKNKKKWKYYESLLFLKNGPLIEYKTETESNFDSSAMDDAISEAASPSYTCNETSNVVYLENYSEELPLNASSSTCENSTAETKRKKDNHEIEMQVLKQAQEAFSRVMEVATSALPKSNEVEAFFHAMAVQVAKAALPMDEWHALQMKIMQDVQEVLRRKSTSSS